MAQPNADTQGGAPVAEVRRIKIKLVKSPIGYHWRQKATVASLGLRRMHQVVEQTDSPAIRGMLHKVRHLVQVVE